MMATEEDDTCFLCRQYAEENGIVVNCINCEAFPRKKGVITIGGESENKLVINCVSKEAAKNLEFEKAHKLLAMKINVCGAERPPRKVFCQGEPGHEGSHHAVVFWE